MELFRQFFTPIRVTGSLLILIAGVLAMLLNNFQGVALHGVNGKSLTILEGLNRNNLSLIFFNLGLFHIAFGKDRIEDERIEKIKNYALKCSVTFLLYLGLLLATLSSESYPLLLIIGVTQIHYFVLTRICIYRDSTLVYLNPKEYHHGGYNKVSWSQIGISFLIGLIILISCIAFNVEHSLRMVILMCIIHVMLSYAMHWKNTHNRK